MVEEVGGRRVLKGTPLPMKISFPFSSLPVLSFASRKQAQQGTCLQVNHLSVCSLLHSFSPHIAPSFIQSSHTLKLSTMCHSQAMCHSPATPDKAGKHAANSSSNVAIPFAEKLTSTSKVKHASINEPSPASTYGDTVASSCPATPQEVGNHGKYFHAICLLSCFVLLLHVFESGFSVQPTLHWEISLPASASRHFLLEECTHSPSESPAISSWRLSRG